MIIGYTSRGSRQKAQESLLDLIRRLCKKGSVVEIEKPVYLTKRREVSVMGGRYTRIEGGWFRCSLRVDGSIRKYYYHGAESRWKSS